MTTEAVNINQPEFDLDLYIYNLLTSEPFFAEISRHVEKRSSTAIKTAGVRVTEDGIFEMLYNPNFFTKLTHIERLAVLKHEFYHLIFGHVTDRLPGGKMSKKWNIATDLAINSHIKDEIPKMACIPGQGPFAKLPLYHASEWYFNNLPKDMGKGCPKHGEGGEKGDGQGQGGEGEDGDCSCGPDSFDDHSGWGENADKLDPTVREIAKERLRDMMRSAAEAANKQSNGWGSVSADVRQGILDRIGGKIDWRAVLRYFIKTSQRSSKTSTVKRINKRYAYIHPGQKVQRHAKIAISIDQSGSVSDEMLEAFFAELNSLSKIATFTVVPFDTEVDEKLVYTWKKGMTRKKERVKCGGTDFNAPTRYVNEKNFDGHIVLTDMQADKPIASTCQRMWMTTRDCMNGMPFKIHERVIPVD
jgi:predicted metal-dependent peptidase